MNAQLPVTPLESGSETPINARSLIGQGMTCQIDLDGQIYTLRITRAGKLILTK
ncbi:hemin uptake protein HemP [Celeribacter arenosi]